MEYGQQSDPWSWGDDNSDSQPNEWSAWPSNPKPTLPTQNFMPPIEAHHNKQASDYFESINLQNSHPAVNYSQEYWSHQTNRNKGQIYSDSCGNQGNYNNNNTISDVENKEIAPPDNEISRSATGMVPKADMRTYFTPSSQNSKPFVPPMVSNNFQSGSLDPRQSFIQSQLPPKEGANFHNNPLPHPSVNEIPSAQQIMGLPPAPVQVDRPPPQAPCNPVLQKTELTSSAQQMNFYQTLQQPQLHAQQHQQQPQIQTQQKQQTQSQQKQQGLSQQQHHQQQQQQHQHPQQHQLQIQPPQKQQAHTQQMELPKPQMQTQVSHQQMQQHTAANHFPHLTPGSITSMNTFGQMVHPANTSLMQNPSSVHGYGNFQPIPMPIPEKELEARLTPLSTLHDTNSSNLSTNEFHNKETQFQHVNMSNNQMVFTHPNSQDAYNSSLQTLSKQPTPLSSVTELSHKRSESLPQNFPSDTTSHFDRPVYPTVQSGSHNNVNSSCKEELMLSQQQLNSSGSSHPSTSSESLPNHGYNSSLSSSKNSQSLPESDPKIQDQYKAMATNLQHNQPNASHMPLMMVPTAPSAQLKHDQQDQNLISMPNQFQNTNSTYNLNNTVTRPIASSSPLVTNIPENLEQPDDHHPSVTTDLSMQMKSLQLNVDEHTQVLCSLDRNQYLETGHLSNQKESGFVNRPTNVDNLDEGDAPPPGLDRLVTGQVCESHVTNTDPIQVLQMEPLSENDSTRQSTPLSFRGHETRQRHSETEGESESGSRRTGRLVQGQSIGDDTDGREVPGEDNSALNRVVLGQIGGVITPPKQETPTPRSDREAEREREMGRRRMVVGEHAGRDQQQTGNLSDDYRQKHRTRHRLRRGDSSYDEDDRDYDSDRRNEEYKRRDERNRRRKEHRSPPDYRSDEEYEDRRIYQKSGRNERRPRDRDRDRDYNSPERDYRDYREDRRRYRRYEQYSRDYDDEYYHRENRSRPSSRTGSDYRRNMDYSMRSQRSCYHDHTINSSDYLDYSKYSAYEYYEKLRQTDPVRYAAWYEQYMKERYSGYQNSLHYGADKASVHSAQSTSNQRHSVHTPQIVNEKTTRPNEDEYDIHLFSTNHIKGKLDGQNRLVVIDPNHPLDGQRATINLYKLTQPALDSDTVEFFESPGPFIPGVTHRNTVLQYLKRISEKASKSSEKLLYDLIHLTVKGNGEVNEVDVAELLMNSYKKSEKEEWNKAEDIPVEKLPEKEVVAKFRELLQQGNKTEALDWAIDHGAWGHALFLASKMDDRTHNQIMLRFANSIPHNDPLQTLYQLMSGHIPQSSTCCADKKWSDWRPHLAMILGNPTRDHALDRKAIIQLGDSLNAHGRLFAAHFCYVTAQVEFSQFKPDAKLVLLGSSPNQEFNKFASCRAIMLTMCYEYGLKLRQRDFNIPTLQFYKLILAMRLIDSGRSKCALQYCEMLADETVQCRQSDKRLISDVIDISSRLKMLDPTLALSGETDNDPEWLHKLKLYYNNLPDNPNAGMKISNGFSISSVLETSQENITNQVEPLEVHEDVKTFSDPYANYNPSDLTSHLLPTLPVVSHQLPPEVNREDMSGFMMPPPLQPNSYQMEQPPPVEPPVENNYWDNSNTTHNNSSYTPMQQENNSTANKSFFKSSEEQLKLNEVAPTSKKPDAKQPENKSAKNEEQRSGWFGGIWDKLSMRPKNQMRLPDDSNPSIVWDQEKKRWVNLDGDEEGASTVKPPPRAAEMMNQSMMSNAATPAGQPAPGPNKYKLQKGKLMKSNYVDMMGGTKDKDGPSSLGSLPPSMVTAAPVKNNFFIPSPVEGNQNAPIDFITTTTMNPTLPEALPESNKQQVHQPMAPMMYNTPRFPS